MAVLDDFVKIFQEDTKPEMSELAASDYSLYNKNGEIAPYNPDTLVGRKGLYMYDQMRIDDQVKACLTLKKFATLAPSFQIIPASDDSQDIEVAEFVEYCFEKMQGNMTDTVLEIMTALDFGYSISEINYKEFDTGVHRGKIGLKNIKTKQPHYYQFVIDEYSNLLDDGILYQGRGLEERYPISKFIIFSYRIEFSQMIKNSYILPHTDSPRKLVSLMLYLPNKKQEKVKNISGTQFYKVTNPKSKYYSNFLNEQVSFKELKTFYKNSKKIYTLPFDHKYIYGFIKTSKSWHEVKKLNKLKSSEFRRSININLMRS